MLKRGGNDYVMIVVTQLAQTVMHSAIGKITLDKTVLAVEFFF